MCERDARETLKKLSIQHRGEVAEPRDGGGLIETESLS